MKLILDCFHRFDFRFISTLSSACFPLSIILTITILVENLDLTSGRLNPIPEHEVFSNHLCPDPLFSSSIDEPNNTLLIKLAEDYPKFQGFLPCSFEVDVPNGKNGSFVNITAATLNTHSWNFSEANECSAYFKFKHKDEYGDGFEVECHAWKRALIEGAIVLYGHRMIIDYRWDPKRLSFAIFHSSVGHDYHDINENLNELNYFQIHFTAEVGKNQKVCRVQQYFLNINESGCKGSYDLQSICGEYDCQNANVIDQTYNQKVSTDHIPDVTDIPPPEIDLDDEDDDRILTFGTLLFVAITPVVCSVVFFLVYKLYVNPRLEIRYTRSSAESREERLRTCPETSLELQETWHSTDKRSGTSAASLEPDLTPSLVQRGIEDSVLPNKPLL